MKAWRPFLGFWLVNGLLLWVAVWVFPGRFVLGNSILSPLLAAVAAGLGISVLVTLGAMFKPMTDKVSPAMQGMWLTLVYFWLVNAGAIWITARMAGLLGFGVVSYYWVGLLAMVTNLAQWGVWELWGEKEGKSK
jgi:hypothetical protein